MATGNPDFSDLITFTLEHRSKEIADAVTEHNAFLRMLKAKNGVRPAPGGTSIVEPIEFKENENFGWYEGYELLSILPQQVHTSSQWAWKSASVAVTISGTELAKNSGPDAQKDLLRAKIKNAENSMTNGLAEGVYAVGTENSGKIIGGLRHIVSTTPTTGMVGGIDRSDSTNAWWRNAATDLTTDYGDSTKVQGQFHTMWLSLVRGMDHPHAILTDNVNYTAFNDSLLEIQRITQAKRGESGFSELVFRGPGGEAMVVFDPVCPADRTFFVNTDTIKLRPHKDRNMLVSKKRESLNQDAQVTHLFWMGNLVCNQAALNGVLFT